MKISFVIPAYNEEAILPAALRSIVAEVEAHPELFLDKNAEIVVVNNASSDATAEVARSHEFVRVVDESIKGLVQARHTGFIQSRGELVANLDADVVVPKGWLSRVIKEFERDPRLVALSGPYIYYELPLWQRVLVRFFYFFGWINYLVVHKVFGGAAMLQGGNFVIRRDAWERAGGFDTSIAFYGEDIDVARRVSKQGKVKWLWGLPMYTSARRLQGEGMLRTGATYAINYMSILITGRPFTREYKDIRH